MIGNSKVKSQKSKVKGQKIAVGFTRRNGEAAGAGVLNRNALIEKNVQQQIYITSCTP